MESHFRSSRHCSGRKWKAGRFLNMSTIASNNSVFNKIRAPSPQKSLGRPDRPQLSETPQKEMAGSPK